MGKYDKFLQVAEELGKGSFYPNELYELLEKLAEDNIVTSENVHLFSDELLKYVCSVEERENLIEERRGIKQIFMYEVVEEEKVWRRRTVARLDLNWSIEASYVFVTVLPSFSDWIVSPYEGDTGSIKWFENDEGILFRTFEGWEVFTSVEVLDYELDTVNHDGAARVKVIFTKQDGSKKIITA